MMAPDFLLQFEQLFRSTAIATGIEDADCILGVNKTDIAERAKSVRQRKIAFINILPDFNATGTDNDQLQDQGELMFFFVQKYDRKNAKEFLPAMNSTLNKVLDFRARILDQADAPACSWLNRLDWPSSKIIPESNLYEMSGWMLTLKIRYI